jgi:hypothetical protein
MKIIAIEKELKQIPGDAAAEMYKSEAKQVYSLYLKDALREIYLTGEHTAVIVLECADTDEARRILATLPLAQAGIIAFEVHELRPYKGYGRLMRE